jgi:hypothetical protein
MRRLLVGLAIAVALLIGALWFYRLDVLTWAALRSIESAGLGPAEISIDAVGFQGLHARNLMLCGGAIRASELDLAFELAGLARTHLARAEIAGLAARAVGGSPPQTVPNRISGGSSYVRSQVTLAAAAADASEISRSGVRLGTLAAQSRRWSA